jgi:hypothetical protein
MSEASRLVQHREQERTESLVSEPGWKHFSSPKMIKLHQRPSDSPPRTTRKSYGGDVRERNPPESFPRTTRKGHGKDTSYISVHDPCGLFEERIQRVETPRLGVSGG